MWPVCPTPPLGTPLGPLPRLDGHPLAKRGLATYAPHRAKAPPPLAKKGDWPVDGYWGGGNFFFALTPTTLLEWGDVLLGLLL